MQQKPKPISVSNKTESGAGVRLKRMKFTTLFGLGNELVDDGDAAVLIVQHHHCCVVFGLFV